MTKTNVGLVREADGSLTVEVNGQPMQGVAGVTVGNPNGALVIVMPLANVEFSTRREATNVVPLRP
jgi:hypothetical protein